MGAFRTKHVDHAAVGITVQHFLHESAQAVDAFTKIHRTRCDQNPNRTGGNDHDTARAACSTICNVAASAPRFTRTVIVPTMTSIVGTTPASPCGGADNTTGANASLPERPFRLAPREAPRNACRRHANSCWGRNAYRRATALTLAPSANVSATICAFSDAVHR